MIVALALLVPRCNRALRRARRRGDLHDRRRPRRDDHRRPRAAERPREYVGADGQPVLVADLDSTDVGRGRVPGRINDLDGRGGPALIVRIVRVRHAP
jgi:hypothetical protein